jgi:hypothetical protein
MSAFDPKRTLEIKQSKGSNADKLTKSRHHQCSISDMQQLSFAGFKPDCSQSFADSWLSAAMYGTARKTGTTKR